VGLVVVGVAGGRSVEKYDMPEALGMMLSTVSCCGYRGLPQDDVQPYGYILLAVYTNLAVPVLAIALASLISMAVDTPDEKFFYSKIAAPLTEKEIKFMQTFGIDDGDGLLDAKEFVVLTIIRIGNVPPQLVLEIIARFKDITSEEEGAQVPYTSIEGYQPAPPVVRRGVRQTLLQHFGRRSMVAPPPILDQGQNAAAQPLHQVSPLPTAGLQLVNRRGPPPGSAMEAINKRKVRRETARKSIMQRQAQEAKARQSVRLARASVLGGEQSPHNVPFTSPFHGKNMSKSVAPSDSDAAATLSKRPERKLDEVMKKKSEANEDKEKDNVEKRVVVSCRDMMLNSDGEDEGSEGVESEDEGVVLGGKEVEVERDSFEHDDHAIEEVRRPSEISESPEPSAQLEDALRTRTLSMEMDTDSIVKEPRASSFSYKNSALVRRRSERRDTFIPSGTYDIITLQSRRKSVNKLQRKRSVAKIVQRPSLMVREARKTTVQKLKETINDRSNVRASTLHRMNKINAAHLELMRKQLTLQQRISESDDLCFVLFTLLQVLLSDPYVQAFLVWLMWLLAAALFYCLKMNLSFYRGFYMSVNVGYAIYWSQEETDGIEKAFSVCHIIVGQVIVSFALAAFAHTLTNSSKEWYSAESDKEEVSSPVKFDLLQGIRNSMTLSPGLDEEGEDHVDDKSNFVPIKTLLLGHLSVLFKRLHYFYRQNRVHFFLLLYLVFGIVWSSMTVGWPLIESLYFTITSLSTGGIWSIPEDSDDVTYFIVAVFTCTGAPIMCLSGGVFAHRLSRIGEAAHVLKTIQAAITLNELEMMNKLDIDDGDGFIDQTEYIILILVRLKAIRPELIAAIIARFHHLDPDGLGAVPYEIFQITDKTGFANKGSKGEQVDDVQNDDSGLIQVVGSS